MYTFNNDNITTSYIKQLLKDFNLPVFSVWKPNMEVYEGFLYVHESIIGRALATGTPSQFNSSTFKPVYDSYSFGQRIINLTKHLSVNTLNYDSYTHEYLGEYLRFYRDYTGIDLMPLYNCFSNRQVDDISITWTTQSPKGGSVSKTFASDNASKVYVVPIKPNMEYTIYIDCKEKIELVAGYYDNGIIDATSSTSYVFPYASTYMEKSMSSFNKPFIYNKVKGSDLGISGWSEDIKKRLYNQRDNFKLFIKLPASNSISKESSIVILEGNYLENSTFKFNNRDLDLADTKNIICNESGETINTNKYLSKLNLVKVQSFVSHPFSDRLVEYLFDNTITPMDNIGNNISKVQTILKGMGVLSIKEAGIDGVWPNALREKLYNISRDYNLHNTVGDILGYVDKDVETTIVVEV